MMFYSTGRRRRSLHNHSLKWRSLKLSCISLLAQAAVMNYLWKICAGRRRGRPLSVDFSVTAEWLDLLRVAERLVCNHECVGWLPNDERVTKNRAFRVKIMDQMFVPIPSSLSFSLLPTVGGWKIPIWPLLQRFLEICGVNFLLMVTFFTSDGTKFCP